VRATEQSAEERYRSIRMRVDAAESRSGRGPGEVVLIAVSKGHSAQALRTVYELGHRDFGESYVQEWESKRVALPDDIRWHFIGGLQSNKARLLRDVALVHSVDRASVMKRLPGTAEAPVSVLLQVNIGREGQKAGVDPENLKAELDRATGFEGLRVCGLMTIPPFDLEDRAARQHFSRLRMLREECRHWLARTREDRVRDFQYLSMGMSADFDVAIEEGATHVRVGTALFGRRLQAGGRA
jgi:PLP dependent protein